MHKMESQKLNVIKPQELENLKWIRSECVLVNTIVADLKPPLVFIYYIFNININLKKYNKYINIIKSLPPPT